MLTCGVGEFRLLGMPDPIKILQEKIQSLEAALAEAKGKLESSSIELEANEALLKLAMDDMRRIYEDLMRSQTQLMQSDKLATIGLLTAGIVHEINNPLAASKLAFALLDDQSKRLAEFLDKSTSLPADAKKLLGDMADFIQNGKRCTESMSKIVSDIRTFSRSDKGNMSPENLNNIVDSVVNIVWNNIKNKVTLKREYGQIPMVTCNSQQLSQVFLNLLVNASQAIPDAGTITISTGLRGEWVVVKISDTGCGIPDDVKEKMFQPFFTTKGAEEGTGLGLSITRDIVKKHGGDILVESQVGKGTTFTVQLPIESKQL